MNNIYLLIWMHFIADFVLQTNDMAKNKSKSFKWLSIHVIVYSLIFLYFGWQFALINCIADFITDAVSSRITSRLYKAGEIHWFFVIIGLDQALHISTLFYSAKILGIIPL